MRLGIRILVVLLAAALAACSDDSGDGDSADPSASLTEITIDCDEFQEAADRVTQAQADLYGGTGGAEAIDTLIAELEALKEDAPDNVRAALTDMATAFRDAAELLENPTPENEDELTKLAPQLEAASRTITDYVTSECD